MFAKSIILVADPSLAKERRLMLEPSWKKSNTVKALPALTKLRTLIEEPRLA
jgi:hypothetical protein